MDEENELEEVTPVISSQVNGTEEEPELLDVEESDNHSVSDVSSETIVQDVTTVEPQVSVEQSQGVEEPSVVDLQPQGVLEEPSVAVLQTQGTFEETPVTMEQPPVREPFDVTADTSPSEHSIKPPQKQEFKAKSTSMPGYVGYEKKLFVRISLFIVSLTLLVVTVIFYLNVRTTSFYTEKASVDYQVCLSKNDYYSSSCIGEDVEYLSAISDKIRIDFNYDAVYLEMREQDLKYYIKSKLLIKTVNEPEKELLKQEKKITEPKEISTGNNVVVVSESVDIPFQEYNDYAHKYKNDYSLLSNSQLIVSLMLVDGDNEERELSAITIPLTKTTYNISKYELKEQTNEYSIESKKAFKNMILILIAVMALLTLWILIKLVKFLLLSRKRESKYEKKLKQILNVYDRVIVTLNDNNRILNNQEVYKVKSFLELLDVRDTIDKPILYYKVNDVKTEFYVQDVDKVYKYTLKEADLDDKK